MDEQKIRILRETGHYLSVPKGVSMYPMLKSRENVVDVVELQGKLKKYDVALYYRKEDNKCVLHRVIAVKDTHYVFFGDNCWQREMVPHGDVMGVAARFFRKGKWVDVDDRRYMAYVRFWYFILPLRRPVYWLRDKAKQLYGRIRGKR